MTTNPWLPQTPDTQRGSVSTQAVITAAPTTGPSQAIPGSVPVLDVIDRLGSVTMNDQASSWLVGAHGGAGETVLGHLTGGVPTGHRWPIASSPGRPLLIVARTHHSGLLAAQRALAEWMSGAAPGLHTWTLAGLVLVTDAPGRLPKSLAQQADVIAAGAPRAWRIPFIDQLRTTGEIPTAHHKDILRFLEDVTTIATQRKGPR